MRLARNRLSLWRQQPSPTPSSTVDWSLTRQKSSTTDLSQPQLSLCVTCGVPCSLLSRNVISYQTTLQPFVPLKTLTESGTLSLVLAVIKGYCHIDPLSLYAESLLAYDDVDADVLQCYHEMTLANLLYHAMKEGACSEQSSRMTAMDSASKNAGKTACSHPYLVHGTSLSSILGEMIDRLTLTFNRTRQAVITRELIEIISGAAAV